MTTTSTTPTTWTKRASLSAMFLVFFGLLATSAVALTGAPRTEEQGPVARVEDRAHRVIAAARGARIGAAVVDVESSDLAGDIDEGALVERVTSGGPAADAGLQEGDIVVEFDDERVRSVAQLTRLVRETPLGRSVPVVVIRDGARVSLSVTPDQGASVLSAVEGWLPDVDRWRDQLRENMPELRSGDAFRFDIGPDMFRGGRRLGIGVSGLGPQLAEYFGVEQGVLVTSVQSRSVAAAAGLRAGDVIIEAGGEPVDDTRTLRRLVADVEPPAMLRLEVSRDGSRVTLEAQFEADDMPRAGSRPI